VDSGESDRVAAADGSAAEHRGVHAAGENGYPIFAGGPVNPLNVIGERLAIYQDAMKAAGVQTPDDWFAALLMVFAGTRTAPRFAPPSKRACAITSSRLPTLCAPRP